MHTCSGHRPLPLSFSPLSGKWVVSRTALNEKPVYVEAEPLSSIDYSAAGLTAAERDSLVPQLYYRQLSAHEKLPDSINGKEMSMHSLRTHEAFFNSSLRDLLKRTSGIRLMMESLPERVDLEDPKEAFRTTADGIEFIDIATNKVNANRSARFTKAMKARGFQFPGKEFSANVTSRKQYDEGYMMIDSEGKAFHVKQQAEALKNAPAGCETERKAAGQAELATFATQMADYRARIAARDSIEGKPYLSTYYIQATSYSVLPE